jgi:hypothetical protein
LLEQLHLLRGRGLGGRLVLLLAAALITMKSTKATIVKLITLLMNSPKLMVGAPACLACARGS